LTGVGQSNFEQVVTQLRANPDWRVQLTGKASPEGPSDYNLSLSIRRVRLIEAALTERLGGARTAVSAGSSPPAGCHALDTGVFACGEVGATGESDRQVRVDFSAG
jgi:outer membrane protein OmpA-like peptidoglycan-associated protein